MAPCEVAKAKIQARCLLGRAQIEALTRHRDPANRDGYCVLCFNEKPSLGSLEHFLPSGILVAGQDDDMKMQFLLDCSNLLLVISLAQA